MCNNFLQIPAVHPGLLFPVDTVGSCQGLHHTGVSTVCLNFEMVTFNNVSDDFARGGGTKANNFHCNLEHKNNEFLFTEF